MHGWENKMLENSEPKTGVLCSKNSPGGRVGPSGLELLMTAVWSTIHSLRTGFEFELLSLQL